MDTDDTVCPDHYSGRPILRQLYSDDHNVKKSVLPLDRSAGSDIRIDRFGAGHHGIGYATFGPHHGAKAFASIQSDGNGQLHIDRADRYDLFLADNRIDTGHSVGRCDLPAKFFSEPLFKPHHPLPSASDGIKLQGAFI